MVFLSAALLALGLTLQAEPPKSPSALSVAAAANPKVNINKATLDELVDLPGVGEVLAQRIIDGRPYKRVGDLEKVEGIGPKKMKELRPLIRVK